MTRLNRNKVVEILRLTSCENLVCDRKEFIGLFDTFIYSEPVKRSKNRSDVTRFWGSGDSTSKRILDITWRKRKQASVSEKHVTK